MLTCPPLPPRGSPAHAWCGQDPRVDSGGQPMGVDEVMAEIGLGETPMNAGFPRVLWAVQWRRRGDRNHRLGARPLE